VQAIHQETSGPAPANSTPRPAEDGTRSGPPAKGPSLSGKYRRERAQRRRPSQVLVRLLILLAVIGLSFYYGPTVFASFANPPDGAGGNAPGSGTASVDPSISFGTPTVYNVTCGDGVILPVESVPWVGSNVPLATSQIYLELVELIDGDIDGAPAPPPAVTSTSVCAGAVPNTFPAWYAVLQAPGATNLGYFAYSQGWHFLNSSATSVAIANGSALVFVQRPLPDHLSFALCVTNDLNTPPFYDCAHL
jgi:hypothetical protein